MIPKYKQYEISKFRDYRTRVSSPFWKLSTWLLSLIFVRKFCNMVFPTKDKSGFTQSLTLTVELEKSSINCTAAFSVFHMSVPVHTMHDNHAD